MNFKSIRWRLSLSYAGIALLAALLLGGIMLAVLQRYYINQEIDYLTQNAASMSQIVADAQSKGIPGEALEQILTGFAFFSNTQIHLFDSDGEILLDTGLPQERTTLSFDPFSDVSNAPMGFGFSIEAAPPIKSDENLGEIIGLSDTMGEVIVIGGGSANFPGWLIDTPVDQAQIQPIPDTSQTRSPQVVQHPFYNQDGNLLGTIQLSNGPAYGTEIVRSVAWGWAISALASVLLAAFAGMWVSRRFSTPLENLTRTTAQMASGNLSARVDISSQDEFGLLANSFNQMAENIEGKVATLRRFVADAAHELHTPLTALRINLEIIDDKHVPRALEKVEQMSALTRNLLSLSQLEAFESVIKIDDVDLAALLQDLAEPYASRAEQAELGFNLEITDGPVKIKGEAAQLGTLIHNLLDNAIKFTPAGGQVKIKLNKQDDAVQLTVTDTGIGIPKDDLPHLFSRFHRGRNASAYPGNGLGLAIVRNIADQHNASITVESNTNGTEFVVEFTPYD